ncbi:MAG: glycosyltransferase family 2 protein [Verrucomicrobiota bacterium JB022]|nr:glycosyltransferase family 2 protein [Verrucomicrobiota bacterium JB022]
MSASPRFSIILPTRARHGTLGRALASLWAQTYPDFEVILVDANDPDERVRQVPALQPLLADPRLRVIEMPVASPSGVSRNAALRVARGEWIVYQDDDDAARPDRLARLVERIEREPDCPLLLAGLCYHLRERRRLVQCDREVLTGDERWTVAFPSTLTFCHRREGAPVFPEEFRGGEDNYFYASMLACWQPAKVPVVNVPLVDVYPQPSPHLVAKQRGLVRTWRCLLRDFRAQMPPRVRRHFVLHTVLSRYKYCRLDYGFARYGAAYLRQAGLRGGRYLLNILLARSEWGRRRAVS